MERVEPAALRIARLEAQISRLQDGLIEMAEALLREREVADSYQSEAEALRQELNDHLRDGTVANLAYWEGILPLVDWGLRAGGRWDDLEGRLTPLEWRELRQVVLLRLTRRNGPDAETDAART